MISMTWPQYLRRECRIGDFVVPLSSHETEILAILLLRYPAPTNVSEIIEMVYPDPDQEPEWSEDCVYIAVMKLGRKIGQFRIECHGRNIGYRLCQRPEDVARHSNSRALAA